MQRFYRRAIKDILENRFLTAITVVTIALSILIAAAFALFFVNAGDMLNLWKKGMRMMVYLKANTSEAETPGHQVPAPEHRRGPGSRLHLQGTRP